MRCFLLQTTTDDEQKYLNRRISMPLLHALDAHLQPSKSRYSTSANVIHGPCIDQEFWLPVLLHRRFRLHTVLGWAYLAAMLALEEIREFAFFSTTLRRILCFFLRLFTITEYID